MGRLVEGIWTDEVYDAQSSGGRFIREDAGFRDRVTADGSSGFKAEPGRYHLYVSWGCPWAHRTLIYRALKQLEEVISVSVLDWYLGANGWEFRERDGATGDKINGKRYLHEVYTLASPQYTGRVTVPVLWDTRKATIVNNESADIIRMLNTEFDAWGRADLDLYPAPLRPEIDRLNDRIYRTVNNGVYKAGFATGQKAYEQAYEALFATLDELEQRLGEQRFLVGDAPTEADWRLFPTLIRFDPVYHGHFKCNRQRLAEFPNLSRLLRDLYHVPGVAETVDFHHIK
ncbi:MAG: glutathione S-transferase family protein, partial [Gammaproteobacteria bacterium]